MCNVAGSLLSVVATPAELGLIGDQHVWRRFVGDNADLLNVKNTPTMRQRVLFGRSVA
jgi:hypothetical protein